jgi:hypothetical protein
MAASIRGLMSVQISAQMSWKRLPSARGCLDPRISAYGSLYSNPSASPQATNIGNCDCSMSATTVRKAFGHDSGGPSGERDQSCARMSAPTLPPPTGKPAMTQPRRIESPPL